MTIPASFRDDRYAVIRLLGEGGQAASFEAVDKKSGKHVVVKRFRVRGAGSWKEVELAEREAKVLASVDHENLPRYVDHFEEGGELFLVTEHIEGESLEELRKRRATIGEADIVRFLRDASSALDYLHGRAPPIIHRDIKPSNVLRRPDGSFCFIDFGAVRDRMKPQGGSTVVGTFGYMAPEQFQGRAMPSSDVYAVATTALVMLTGREPEDLPHRGLAIDVAASLRDTRVRPELVRAFTAMLEPDPDRRASRIAPLLASIDATPREGAARPERGRKARKREERERKHEERERRRQEQTLARRERRRRWREGQPVFIPWPLVVMFSIGLLVAEIAITVALRVVVPIVLSLLSLVIGKPLREAAKSVAAAGVAANERLRAARHDLRYGDPRLRIEVPTPPEPPPGVRVPGEDEEAAEEEAREAERRDARARRSD